MAELVEAGKVRWVGESNFDLQLLERCERIRHVDSSKDLRSGTGLGNRVG
jgi:diketogulonate reductase-like aldo/keto reductase